LHNIKEIIDFEAFLIKNRDKVTKELLQEAKELGFSDRQLAKLLKKSEEEVTGLRKEFGLHPEFKLVDTCAAEIPGFHRRISTLLSIFNLPRAFNLIL
jgi:carbamoyl-phosphate synthase large subunit